MHKLIPSSSELATILLLVMGVSLLILAYFLGGFDGTLVNERG